MATEFCLKLLQTIERKKRSVDPQLSDGKDDKEKSNTKYPCDLLFKITEEDMASYSSSSSEEESPSDDEGSHAEEHRKSAVSYKKILQDEYRTTNANDDNKNEMICESHNLMLLEQVPESLHQKYTRIKRDLLEQRLLVLKVLEITRPSGRKERLSALIKELEEKYGKKAHNFFRNEYMINAIWTMLGGEEDCEIFESNNMLRWAIKNMGCISVYGNFARTIYIKLENEQTKKRTEHMCLIRKLRSDVTLAANDGDIKFQFKLPGSAIKEITLTQTNYEGTDENDEYNPMVSDLLYYMSNNFIYPNLSKVTLQTFLFHKTETKNRFLRGFEEKDYGKRIQQLTMISCIFSDIYALETVGAQLCRAADRICLIDINISPPLVNELIKAAASKPISLEITTTENACDLNPLFQMLKAYEETHKFRCPIAIDLLDMTIMAGTTEINDLNALDGFTIKLLRAEVGESMGNVKYIETLLDHANVLQIDLTLKTDSVINHLHFDQLESIKLILTDAWPVEKLNQKILDDAIQYKNNGGLLKMKNFDVTITSVSENLMTEENTKINRSQSRLSYVLNAFPNIETISIDAFEEYTKTPKLLQFVDAGNVLATANSKLNNFELYDSYDANIFLQTMIKSNVSLEHLGFSITNASQEDSVRIIENAAFILTRPKQPMINNQRKCLKIIRNRPDYSFTPPAFMIQHIIKNLPDDIDLEMTDYNPFNSNGPMIFKQYQFDEMTSKKTFNSITYTAISDGKDIPFIQADDMMSVDIPQPSATTTTTTTTTIEKPKNKENMMDRSKTCPFDLLDIAAITLTKTCNLIVIGPVNAYGSIVEKNDDVRTICKYSSERLDTMIINAQSNAVTFEILERMTLAGIHKKTGIIDAMFRLNTTPDYMTHVSMVDAFNARIMVNLLTNLENSNTSTLSITLRTDAIAKTYNSNLTEYATLLKLRHFGNTKDVVFYT
jgi:hypothetical protein